MHDFIFNKLRLGGVAFSIDGGPNGSIPVLSPKLGIFNIIIPFQNQYSNGNNLYQFIGDTFDNYSSLNKWLLIPVYESGVMHKLCRFLFSDSNINNYYRVTE